MIRLVLSFVAGWSKSLSLQICAFKCFKTASICSNQAIFDEFEREVAILASIAHPNIIDSSSQNRVFDGKFIPILIIGE